MVAVNFLFARSKAVTPPIGLMSSLICAARHAARRGASPRLARRQLSTAPGYNPFESRGALGYTPPLTTPLSVFAINPAVLRTEYAVRGEIVLRAAQIRDQLKRDASLGRPSSFPFDGLVECNIGNPQALRQQPISFNRQVLALLTMPEMLGWPSVRDNFPPDALARAEEYLSYIPEGLGAYTESQGFKFVRDQVAAFITSRDEGVRASADDIFLTDGASKGVQMLLKMILCDPLHGALVPVPQYPLYSASLALDSCQMLGYGLCEANDWSLPVEELERSLNESRNRGVQARVLVVINPGNPTGNSLPLENMRDIVRFCANENLVLMADEVYQENVYREGRPFHSFKKVLKQMPEGEPPLQLVSFHSTSKANAFFLSLPICRTPTFAICQKLNSKNPPNVVSLEPAPPPVPSLYKPTPPHTPPHPLEGGWRVVVLPVWCRCFHTSTCRLL